MDEPGGYDSGPVRNLTALPPGVGWALKAVATAHRAGGPLAVPCHRVVNREGALSGRHHFETPTAMEERLRAEAVPFLADGRVDLAACVWEATAALG